MTFTALQDARPKNQLFGLVSPVEAAKEGVSSMELKLKEDYYNRLNIFFPFCIFMKIRYFSM